MSDTITASTLSPFSAERTGKADIDGAAGKTVPRRPPFNTQITSDRLREATKEEDTPFAPLGTKLKKDRTSYFTEVGLETPHPSLSSSSLSAPPPPLGNGRRLTSPAAIRAPDMDDKQESSNYGAAELRDEKANNVPADTSRSPTADTSPNRAHERQSSIASRWYSKLSMSRPRPKLESSNSVPGMASSTKLAFIAMLLAVIIPTCTLHLGKATPFVQVATAVPLDTRATTPTKVCRRWAQQVALLNGTLYAYGGRSSTSEGQTDNTWNSDFLTLDLTKDWETSSPALKGLTVPDGPPAVAMGYLWHDYQNLFLYGGSFSDTPYVDPAPQSIWRYSPSDSKWTEQQDPQTSAGNYSEPASEPVYRASEGAGLSVPELGLSWYFGGHLDWATVPGWSRQVDRVYLKSLLEFTHPGYVNSGVQGLAQKGAPSTGAFRNITQGGVQADEFPERADGVLVFVPGWGKSGVLIGLGGGTAEDFTHDLGTLDVYDIASSQWFHQKTSGNTPSVRVNACAVIASAPDASSFQIYMFGGQNLQPYGDQTQYNDMYILTIPSFSWIKVETSDSTPTARAGHTCSMQDGQMIVMGGYGGSQAACEDSGIFVFDASSLQWKDSFEAGDHEANYHPDNSVLAGSYGYTVPDVVQNVVGGDSKGSASATTPAAGPASSGPFATGQPPVFTITEGAPTQTVTSPAHTGVNSGSDDASGGSHHDHDANPGLIAAGIIAGLAGLAALYLGFCAILYRRQIRAYKQHLAASNHYAPTPSGGSLKEKRSGGASRTSEAAKFLTPKAAFFAAGNKKHNSYQKHSKQNPLSYYSPDDSHPYTGAGGDGPHANDDWDASAAAGTPWLWGEPKWMHSHSDDYSPMGGSGTGSGSGNASSSLSRRPGTSGSGSSTEGLLEGQEPSFFNVVLGPRRALRVVNGIE